MSTIDPKEYGREGKVRRNRGLRPWYPVLGLLLLVSAGAIAFALSLPLTDLVVNNGILVPDASLTRDLIQAGMGGLIFVIVILLVFLVFAAFAPKPSKMTSERQLERERRENIAEQKAKRKRKRQANKQLAAQRAREAQQKDK